MKYQYTPQRVCPYIIEVDVEGDVLKKATFHGGCPGNLQALTSLTAGMTYAELKEKFRK